MKLRWFSHNFDYILLGVLAVGFFVATSAFNYKTQTPDYIKFLSPDETANYFFTRNYAATGEISAFEPANLIAEEIVHPRSIRSDNGWLKPVSFLGIILIYGKIGAWLGSGVIPYLTPFFGALGLLFFYGFVRKLFGRRTALVAAFLLASFPIYFFYTARSMFHNVLFIALLLGAAYGSLSCVPARPESAGSVDKKFWKLRLSRGEIKTYFWSVWFGLFLGAAVGVRASELLWLAPILFISWVFYARRLGLARLILIIGGLWLALMPVFYWNQILYSSPFHGGYGEMNQSITELSQAGGKILKSTVHGQFSEYKPAATTVVKNVFYFGCQPRQSLNMFSIYVIRMFFGLCLLAFLGGLVFLIRILIRPKRGAYLYLLCWLVLSMILVFYYGSWKFNDNPDPHRFTIGNSYTRYWLPIYILALPLAALFITSFARAASRLIRLKPGTVTRARLRPWISGGLMAAAVGTWLFFSVNFTFFGSEEGLATLYYNALADREAARFVLSATEPEAIIVTQYHDKQLFPDRRIISALLTTNVIDDSIGRILKRYPIYYYNFVFSEQDLQYLNERKLPPFGFTLKLKEKRGVFGLYQLELKK